MRGPEGDADGYTRTLEERPLGGACEEARHVVSTSDFSPPMSTKPATESHSDRDGDSPPTLGARENFWGETDDEPANGGHDETLGTDPAAYVAHQLALRVLDPVCSKTGRELTEPTLYLPKQTKVADGKTIEYRQHRHCRRVEPASGRINWGETTSTAIPEFDYDVFRLCVHTYLAERGCRLTAVDNYLEYAERVWHDPQFGSKDALEQFVHHVREEEADT